MWRLMADTYLACAVIIRRDLGGLPTDSSLRPAFQSRAEATSIKTASSMSMERCQDGGGADSN
jgi:hypothetical protein